MGRHATLPGQAPSVEDIARRLRPFLQGRNVLKAIVFGSYARGTNTRRSDLDLALIVETNSRFLELIYAPGELEAISHRPFIRTLMEEGIVIYER
jgi:predicted nucleotidyltransferase